VERGDSSEGPLPKGGGKKHPPPHQKKNNKTKKKKKQFHKGEDGMTVLGKQKGGRMPGAFREKRGSVELRG